MFNEVTYKKAEAPEFTAYTQRTPDGIFTVGIIYQRGIRSGSSEVIAFTTEQAMKKFLDGETRDHVRYSSYRPLPGETFPPSGQIQSRQKQRQPSQQTRQPEPEPEPEQPSLLQQIGYTRQESDTIISASYTAAAQLRESWFVTCAENAEAVFRWVSDNQLMPTPDNLGKAMDYLRDNNNLVRRNRKRGEPLPTTYISPTPKLPRNQTREQAKSEIEQLKNMPMEQLRELERRRQVEAKRRLNLSPDFVL